MKARAVLQGTLDVVRRSRDRIWRIAIAFAVGLVAIYALYVIGVNIALRANVLSSYLDDTEEEVRISYSSAWTLWPGQVHVEDLLVATQDSDIQSEVTAVRASATIALLPLLDRYCIISGIRAKSVSVRIRGLRTEAEAIASESALPPMRTWGALSLSDPASLPKDDPDSLWHIVLDDASGSVDEVWVENLRITGRMRARGTWDFAPLEKVVFENVRVLFDEVRFDMMGEAEPTIADDVDGHLRFSVPNFEVPGHDLTEIVRFADIDADLAGALFAGRVATATHSDVSVEDGSGAFSVRMAARQGRMKRGSHVVFETSRMGVESGPSSASLRDATIDVLATSDEDMVTAVDARSLDVRLLPAPKSIIHIESPKAAIRGRMVPHFMKPTFEGGEASIPAANMGLSGLDGIADGIRFRKGIAFARGWAKVDRDGQATGEGHSRVEEIDAVVNGVAIQGRSTSEMHLVQARLAGDPSVKVRSFVTLDDIAMKAGEERVDKWWARLELEGMFSRKGDAPWAIDAKMRGRFRDAAPAVAILDGADILPGIVTHKLQAEGLVTDAAINVLGSRVQLDVKDATGEDLRVRGRMVVTEQEMRASYLVQTDLIDVGVSLVGGGMQVQLLAGEDWLIRERAFLSGFGTGSTKRQEAPAKLR